MLRFPSIALLTLVISVTQAVAAPKHDRERHPSAHDLNDYGLKESMKAIKANGYQDAQLVPWFVMIAKNSSGKDVMLLVDPKTLTAFELDPSGAATAEASMPKLSN